MDTWWELKLSDVIDWRGLRSRAVGRRPATQKMYNLVRKKMVPLVHGKCIRVFLYFGLFLWCWKNSSRVWEGEELLPLGALCAVLQQ